MPKKITYNQVADSLLNDWHWSNVADSLTVPDHINQVRDSLLQIVLLADIAKSLRVLRCSNFTDIPYRLSSIRVAVEGLRRETRARARAHRRRL